MVGLIGSAQPDLDDFCGVGSTCWRRNAPPPTVFCHFLHGKD
jgi:hypothetical protein